MSHDPTIQLPHTHSPITSSFSFEKEILFLLTCVSVLYFYLMSSSSLSPPKQCGDARPNRSPPRFIETCSIYSRPSEDEGASPRTFCREDTVQHSNKAPQGTRDLDVEETSCTEFDDEQHKDEHFKLNRNNKVARAQHWLDNFNHSAFSFNTQSSHVQAITTSVAHPVQNLSQFAVTCIIVNYISTGYILLPHAFAQAGIGLAILCFVFVSAQSYLTAIFFSKRVRA